MKYQSVEKITKKFSEMQKSSAEMEFNSRLDDKITACGENQKWQSVTLDFLFSGVHLC